MTTPIYTCVGDLGDSLFVTPVFRNNPMAILAIEDHPEARYVSQVFDGMATFSYLPHNSANQINDWKPHEHKSLRILREVGRPDDDPLPWVIIKDEEIEAAHQLIGHIERPILVSFAVKGLDTSVGQYRLPSPDVIRFVIDILIGQGYQPMVMARNVATRSWNNVTYLDHVPLRTFLGCCKLIGRYCGIDTGALHAVVATGGRALGVVPSPHPTYFPPPVYLWRGDRIWKGRTPRAFYLEYRDIYRLPDEMIFLT